MASGGEIQCKLSLWCLKACECLVLHTTSVPPLPSCQSRHVQSSFPSWWGFVIFHELNVSCVGWTHGAGGVKLMDINHSAVIGTLNMEHSWTL